MIKTIGVDKLGPDPGSARRKEEDLRWTHHILPAMRQELLKFRTRVKIPNVKMNRRSAGLLIAEGPVAEAASFIPIIATAAPY